MTLPDPLSLICAILAVTIPGWGKGGFAGLGMLSMPIMAQGMNPIKAPRSVIAAQAIRFGGVPPASCVSIASAKMSAMARLRPSIGSKCFR